MFKRPELTSDFGRFPNNQGSTGDRFNCDILIHGRRNLISFGTASQSGIEQVPRY
jgi:hypothetical protein